MGGRYDTGVKYYTTGTVKLHFPENDVKCRFCPMWHTTNEGGQNRCRLTGRVLFGLDYIPDFCPIQFEEENKHE